MPTYDIRCSHEHLSEVQIPLCDFEKPIDCPTCGMPATRVLLPTGAAKSAIFPYTTTHLDGKGTPITVESLPHLRSLERIHGVKATAFSDHKSNWEDPLPQSRDLPQSRKGWF